MKTRLERSVLLALIGGCAVSLSLVTADSDARGGRGGRGGVRASAHVSVHGGGHTRRPPPSRPPGGGAQRPPPGGGAGAGGPAPRPPAGGPPPRPPAAGYRPPPPPPGGYWNHPVGVGLAVATTAAVVGSIVYSLPPSCTRITVDGVTYQQCGSTWYEPQYAGTTVQYVVVDAP